MKDQKGFTLPELLMVIVVITLLCLAVIPQFFSMQNARRQTEMEKIVAVVQAGIQREQARSIATDNKSDYLPNLDDQSSGVSCTDCFSKILEKPLRDPLWFKASANEYYYSRNGNTGSAESYQEEGDDKITYDSQSGVISAQQIQKP
jgi:prepilin-type N-terminal cleavage/methylation domain-containing protein